MTVKLTKKWVLITECILKLTVKNMFVTPANDFLYGRMDGWIEMEEG